MSSKRPLKITDKESKKENKKNKKKRSLLIPKNTWVECKNCKLLCPELAVEDDIVCCLCTAGELPMSAYGMKDCYWDLRESFWTVFGDYKDELDQRTNALEDLRSLVQEKNDNSDKYDEEDNQISDKYIEEQKQVITDIEQLISDRELEISKCRKALEDYTSKLSDD